jgi:hypothetical protein
MIFFTARMAIRQIRFLFFFLTLICTSCSNAYSQTPGKFMGVKFGYNHVTTRNDAISPLLSSGGSALYAIEYYNEKPKSVLIVEVDFANTRARSSVGSPSDIVYGTVEYKYYRKVSRWSTNRFQVGAGGAITVYAIARNFTPKFVSSEFSIITSATIGPAAYIRYLLSEKHHFTMAFKFALMGYTVKSGYTQPGPDNLLGDVNFSNVIESGHLLPIGKLIAACISLSYNRKLSERMFLKISGDVNYLRIKDRRTFTFANNPILCSLSYKLTK